MLRRGLIPFAILCEPLATQNCSEVTIIRYLKTSDSESVNISSSVKLKLLDSSSFMLSVLLDDPLSDLNAAG